MNRLSFVRARVATSVATALLLVGCNVADESTAPPSTPRAPEQPTNSAPLRLAVPPQLGSAVPQPTIQEAFVALPCGDVPRMVGESSVMQRIATSEHDGTLVCGLNLVPDPTFATGRPPKDGEPVSLIVLMSASTTELPALTIHEFIASGMGEVVSLVTDQPDLSVPTGVRDDAAVLTIGANTGVIARQNESVVTATWTDAAGVQLIAAARDEAATLELVRSISGEDVSVAAP